MRVIVGCCCLITLIVPVWQHQKDDAHDFIGEAREPPAFVHGLGCETIPLALLIVAQPAIMIVGDMNSHHHGESSLNKAFSENLPFLACNLP